MSNAANDLIDFAREGEQQPFVELFAEPDGVSKFLSIRDEYTQATPLHMASANGHTELVRFLLEKLGTPENRKQAANAANDMGNLPLHWAALNGCLDVVKLLVEAGADPLKKNQAGFDSCYQAERAGQEDVANYLYSVASLDEFEKDGDEDIVVTEKDV